MITASKEYIMCYPDYLDLKEGAEAVILKSEPETSEWYGWHFCRDENGKEGWISTDFLDLESSLITKNYSAKELNARKGQKFSLVNESCNWYWCESEEGNEGWLPKNIF